MRAPEGRRRTTPATESYRTRRHVRTAIERAMRFVDGLRGRGYRGCRTEPHPNAPADPPTVLLPLHRESLPRGLPGDAKRFTNSRPRHATATQLGDPSPQIRLDLTSHHRNSRDVREHLLIIHRLPHRQPNLTRSVAIRVHDRRGGRHALVADLHPGPGDQHVDLGVGLCTE